jgi:hypothetical protein
MGLEQRVLIKYPRLKGPKRLDIYHELAFTFDEEALTIASVKHWICELETGQTILANEDRPGRPAIDHSDMSIVKVFGEVSFLQFDHKMTCYRSRKYDMVSIKEFIITEISAFQVGAAHIDIEASSTMY